MSFGYSDAKGMGVPNLVHASGNKEEAKKEIALWFQPEQLYDYSDLNENFHTNDLEPNPFETSDYLTDNPTLNRVRF